MSLEQRKNQTKSHVCSSECIHFKILAKKTFISGNKEVKAKSHGQQENKYPTGRASDLIDPLIRWRLFSFWI